MTTMMAELYKLLDATTLPIRKGDVISDKVVDGVKITTIDAMPNTEEALAQHPALKIVDCILVNIGVDMVKAEPRRAELLDMLKRWPVEGEIASGPSYITVGATMGDQGKAFQLYALGDALGIWHMITPKILNPNISDADAERWAGNGFVMITGLMEQKR